MKVLLIEDDKFFQKFYSAKLREQNIEVDVASDGEEGLLKMQQFNPNVVLLDLIMPKRDGFSVLEARSLDENLKKIPVIVFSSLDQEKDLEKAKNLGATDYINKSFFNFDEIMVKISKMYNVNNTNI